MCGLGKFCVVCEVVDVVFVDDVVMDGIGVEDVVGFWEVEEE